MPARPPRFALRPLLCALCLLSACAPITAQPSAAPTFRAAFSDAGVAWVSGGRACVARAPAYGAVCPTLPAAVDVAWNGGDAWAALPGPGLAVTLDRAARTVAVGRVVALSATRAYREDGSAVDYAGQPARGVRGAPTLALTGGDGQEYVLLAGRLVRVTDGARLAEGAGPYLAATPEGVRPARRPTLVTPGGTYQLGGGRLERQDATGRVVASVPHVDGRLGVVGAEIVTVTPGGEVRAYGADLARVR